jgi:hypothetical protein
MQFRTEILVTKMANQISYDDAILFIGSCFSVNIHKKLRQLKFNTISNPFGIVYNPISLTKQLNRIVEARPYSDSDLYFFNEKWLSFDHHGDFASSLQQECLDQINTKMNAALNQIKSAKFIFITLGSSWVYRWNEDGQVVSNCHKIPAKKFTKQLADTSDMVEQMAKTIHRIQQINSQVQFVFSISPVRHLSDGNFENQVSKGRLFDLIFQMQNQFKNVYYFQAFELLMDDLRDYRFYKTDLIHPSDDAIQYIWEKFVASYFSEYAIQTSSQIEKIISAAHHKPFNPNSDAHQKFITKTLSTIKELESSVPGSFDTEKQMLQINE